MIFDNDPNLNFDPEAENNKNLNLNNNPKWITKNISLTKIVGIVTICVIGIWGLFICYIMN